MLYIKKKIYKWGLLLFRGLRRLHLLHLLLSRPWLVMEKLYECSGLNSNSEPDLPILDHHNPASNPF